MPQNWIIVSDIFYVHEDFLVKGRPYISPGPRRKHSFALITRGKMLYTIGQQSITLSEGEILFIREGSQDIAQTATDDPVYYIVIDFASLNKDFVLNMRNPANEPLKKAFAQMVKVWQAHSPDYLMLCMELMYGILNKLLSEVSVDRGREYQHRRIAEALACIERRMDLPSLSAGEIARECGMSAVTLNRLFRELYGQTTTQYITERRMELAQSLLANSCAEISQIAQQTGYTDVYSFSHAFRRNIGKSPSEWRKTNQENEKEPSKKM